MSAAKFKKVALSYPGMQDSQLRAELQMRTELTIDMGDVMVPPDKSFFADYVSVTEGRDGVALFFGKLGPESLGLQSTVRAGLEVSFPFQQFYGHLYKSIAEESAERPIAGSMKTATFIEAVEASVSQYGYQRITDLPGATSVDKYAAIRANVAMIALFGDDTSMDFFHLDAYLLRLMHGGRRPGKITGLMRVTMSPCLLLYFCEKVSALAQRLKEKNPTFGDDPPPLQLGGAR